MSTQHKPRSASIVCRQRGQAALLTVLLVLGLAATVLVYTLATPAKITIENDKRTAAALAQAKEALIGHAAADNRPGSLPCPDVTNINGGAGSPVPTGDCPGYVAGNNAYIGRLPWRTLGLPDLRDGSGERLWYAVSREFARNPLCGGSPNGANCPLNSGTPGKLKVNIGSTSLDDVIAVVFAPGPVVLSQDRSSANENRVEHYLEGGNELSSSLIGTPPSPFTMGADPASFNDKLLSITRETLFPVVESRVARELRLSLKKYYEDNNYYPYAAPLPGNTATVSTYRGYVPTGVTPACNPPTPDLSTYLPSWFATNNWQQYMVYAVAPRCTARIDTNVSITIALLAPPPPCASGCINLALVQICLLSQAVDATASNCNNTTAGSYLTVSGNNNVRSIVLPASYKLLVSQPNRPCNTIADCLEDTENIDAVDNYAYVKPVRSSANNDNLIIVDP